MFGEERYRNSPMPYQEGLMLGTDPLFQEHPNINAAYTELELLTNMVYFFIILVTCGTILAGALFAIREYQQSFWRRVRLQERERKLDVDEGKENGLAANGVPNEACMVKPTGEGLVQEAKYFPLFTSDYDNYVVTTNLDVVVKPASVPKINVLENADSPAFMAPMTSNGCKKIKYEYEELVSLRKSHESVFTGSRRQIPMSALTRFSRQIPVIQFTNAWRAEATIMELSRVVFNNDVDFATRSILLFMVLAIGASYLLHDNITYYLSTFNEFMDDFDATTLHIITTPDSLVQFVDLIMAYSWSHWNYSSSISDKLDRWKVRPHDRTHNHIYKLAVRVRAGMTEWKASSQREMEFRVSALLKECSRTTHCNEYIGLIPIIKQAVSSEILVFYQALQIIVQSHGECCMEEYLHEYTTDLRKIVQHGLWHKNPELIIKISNEICDYLADKADITHWLKEIAGGMVYMDLDTTVIQALGANSTITSMDAKTINDSSSEQIRADSKRHPNNHPNNHFHRQRSVTPGSWKLHNLPLAK